MTARFWRYASFLVRLDIASSLAIAAALLLWVTWH
jgi:hypothetical protein